MDSDANLDALFPPSSGYTYYIVSLTRKETFVLGGAEKACSFQATKGYCLLLSFSLGYHGLVL